MDTSLYIIVTNFIVLVDLHFLVALEFMFENTEKWNNLFFKSKKNYIRIHQMVVVVLQLQFEIADMELSEFFCYSDIEKLCLSSSHGRCVEQSLLYICFVNLK